MYKTFVFEEVVIHPGGTSVSLRYSFDETLFFTEKITFPENVTVDSKNPSHQAALRTLHLAGGVSYYKAYCAPQMVVKGVPLTKAQADFWTLVYTEGLGEFYYRNKLDFRGLIQFPYTEGAAAEPEKIRELSNRSLVCFGGGKDSLATVELLRRQGATGTLFRIGHHAVITRLAAETGWDVLEVERTIDPTLHTLPNAYNGHVPVSAYVSALADLVAVASGHDAVYISNERSASYGNVQYLGMEVNHQWSKSEVFEKAFASQSQVEYLNLLRPYSELAITKFVSQFPQYFQLLTSCNTNWKLTADRTSEVPLWCGHCPKCAFVFAMLAPFISEEALLAMFGKNLFTDAELVPTYRELFGIEGIKPLECVGTPEEMAAAMSLLGEKYKGSLVVELYHAEVQPLTTSQLKDVLEPSL